MIFGLFVYLLAVLGLMTALENLVPGWDVFPRQLSGMISAAVIYLLVHLFNVYV